MSIVLSHSTARDFYAASPPLQSLPELPEHRAKLRTSAPNNGLVATARLALTSWNAPAIEPLHILVPCDADRRRLEGAVCHICSQPVQAGSLRAIGSGVFVADIRLCALQAATYLDRLELVEYLYEICGSYALPLQPDGDYLERPPLTSVEELSRYADGIAGTRGVEEFKSALRYVRDGSRSPMETAFAMLLVLPKRFGGLGIRDMEMNHRVQVTGRARALTRRKELYFDAYHAGSRTDFEYNGFHHDEDERRVIDEERRSALASMGYGIIEVSRGSIMVPANFKRCMSTIMRRVGIRPSRLPDGFEQKQEELRQFVLRRWL